VLGASGRGDDLHGLAGPGSVVLLTKGRGTLVDALLAIPVLLDVSLDAAPRRAGLVVVRSGPVRSGPLAVYDGHRHAAHDDHWDEH